MTNTVFCIGFQAAYSQLVFAGKVELDPCAEVHDAKTLLAKSLAALLATQTDVRRVTFIAVILF